MLGRNLLTRERICRLVCDGICEGGEQVKVKVE